MTRPTAPAAQAWVATVERLLAAKGDPFDHDMATALGCGFSLHAQLQAKGHPGLGWYLAPIAQCLGLTLAKIEAAGPTGIA